MNYEDWSNSVPETIKSDSLWKMTAYRLALFLADIGWYDVTKLMQDRRTIGLSDQLYRSLGSISANLAEGYSRGTGKDRARFYEYALGSARESRDWYFKGRHVLGQTVVEHRLQLLAEIIRLLLTMTSRQPGHILREEDSLYQIKTNNSYTDMPAGLNLDNLLQNIPLPDP
ncbi:MAG: four helix bundle protein [Chloroflexi bacterium]|nr:four helix bundle protein [Chloroflexota bacterium]